jgi:hypothetical protein
MMSARFVAESSLAMRNANPTSTHAVFVAMVCDRVMLLFRAWSWFKTIICQILVITKQIWCAINLSPKHPPFVTQSLHQLNGIHDRNYLWAKGAWFDRLTIPNDWSTINLDQDSLLTSAPNISPAKLESTKQWVETHFPRGLRHFPRGKSWSNRDSIISSDLYLGNQDRRQFRLR